MKERPILFSAPMVRAILGGSKTQTRRVVKPQPTDCDGSIYDGKIYGPEMYEPVAYDRHGEMVPGDEIFGIYTEDGDWGVKCPYGQPGDRLWVREAWHAARGWDNTKPREIAINSPIFFPANNKHINLNAWDEGESVEYGKLRPSMFMPRWASRTMLEITGVRVERLNDCSEADAKAEGIEAAFENTRWRMYNHRDGEEHLEYVGPRWTISPVRSYRSLWLSINGAGSWDTNPWVWVIEFKRVQP